MSDDMAWAIFTKECHLSGNDRTPKSRFGFGAFANIQPQQFPREFIDYAVARGAAEEVPSPSKQEAPANAGIEKRARKGRQRGE